MPLGSSTTPALQGAGNSGAAEGLMDAITVGPPPVARNASQQQLGGGAAVMQPSSAGVGGSSEAAEAPGSRGGSEVASLQAQLAQSQALVRHLSAKLQEQQETIRAQQGTILQLQARSIPNRVWIA